MLLLVRASEVVELPLNGKRDTARLSRKTLRDPMTASFSTHTSM